MIYALVALLVAGVAVSACSSTEFGAKLRGAALEKAERSPHFKDGKFRNIMGIPTPPPSEPGERMSMTATLWEFFFGGKSRRPKTPLTTVQSDLKSFADGQQTRVAWLGHSTMLMRIGGKTVLTDPVFSDAIFPIRLMAPKAFAYSQPIQLADLPNIDVVLISHDHYDHLDFASIRALSAMNPLFVTPLGVGSHLRKWGVPEDRIIERDWWQDTAIGGLRLTATPAQHFSGRGLRDRSTTLWASWVMEGNGERLFFSGDSGYFAGFKEIGERFGPFDLTILESGAYNQSWIDVHMLPEQTVQAHLDLGGKVLQPIHWGKFDLALHDWAEPVERLSVAADENGVHLATPAIGQAYALHDALPQTAWWRAHMETQTADGLPATSLPITENAP
ncbi:MAG: MBL fold metallo-hydrolase [Rhodospirillales bacterium]|nr:MBL fold metallo-hydrolase [Rhodospirillales bacterium]